VKVEEINWKGQPFLESGGIDWEGGDVKSPAAGRF
jgi:hypothetical protein